MKIRIIYITVLIMAFSFTGCKDMLDQETYSELAPDNFLNTEEGIESVLYSCFGAGFINGYELHDVYNITNWCTDLEWETGGQEGYTSVLVFGFNWDSETTWLSGVMWERPYRAIRNANSLLSYIDDSEVSDENKELYKAEARFMRAMMYIYLYSWYGTVPLRTSSTDPTDMARCTDDEIKTFIETELREVAPILPFPGEEKNYGRPTRGAALALLCKFYLNQKEWQKAADAAQDVIDLGYYELYNDGPYADMFKVENEINKEYILVCPNTAENAGLNYMNGAFPPNFKKEPESGLVMQSNWNNWAAQYRLYDSFVNSFDASDTRDDCIIKKYINSSGDTISLLDANNTRSFKFWPDPDAISNEHGNDMPLIRYADILLSRAEALNHLSTAPAQEAIDLINQVRERAGVPDLQLADFPTTESLDEHLLQERAWEFYCEAFIRREDQIRFGTFISSAVERGYNAKDYQLLFPIPQEEIDANSNMIQNDGY